MLRHTLLLLAIGATALHADPPMLTNDPESPKAGHWEIFVGASVERLDHEQRWEAPGFEIEYGLLDSLQITWEPAWITRRDENGVTHTGLGDTRLGAKWRFLDDERSGLSASIFPQVTWNTSQRSVDLGLEDPGSQVILPLELQWEIGKTTIFGEFGYIWRQSQDNGLVYGLVVQQALSDKFAVLAEAHGDSGMMFRNGSLILNAGFKWQTWEHTALVGSIGHAVIEGGERAADLVGYLGVQFEF